MAPATHARRSAVVSPYLKDPIDARSGSRPFEFGDQDEPTDETLDTWRIRHQCFWHDADASPCHFAFWMVLW
jgi:hypothetical protein